MLEHQFQKLVTDYAEWNGWVWYHTHDSQRSPGGFPDLVLARERVVFAELKQDHKYPTPKQRTWAQNLTRAGAEVYLWKPRDLDSIYKVLARGSVRVPTPEEGT